MWSFHNNRPIYLQIIEKVQERIILGVYLAGEKIPSVRELASEASVNPNTMQKALSELENAKLLTTHRTSGRFITTDQTLIDALKQQIIREQTLNFLLQMKKIGCNIEDTIKNIESISKENIK